MTLIETIDWEKTNGLVPVIIQDATTASVLMLGFMDKIALSETIDTHQVTFFSRSKNRLWMKGETSGHTLTVIDIFSDCDADALLILVEANGPTCHFGRNSCFSYERKNTLKALESIIEEREITQQENSYVAALFAKGLQRIIQKVGEEAIEVVLAATEMDNEHFSEEVADLIFHVMVLLKAKGISLETIMNVLQKRMNQS